MIRKLIGIVIILISLAGVALSISGTIKVPDVIDSIGSGLDTVQQSLALAKETMKEANDALESVGALATDLGETIEETRPLLEQVTAVTSEDVPESIKTMQAAIPNMAEVAGIIDNTLVTLSKFRIDEEVFGIKIQYDLGINYDPSVPFDQTVTSLGNSMDGLPEQLESLGTELAVADENLATISQSMDTIAGNLADINGRIAEIGPQIDAYIGIVTDLNDAIRLSRARIKTQLETIKLGVVIILVWLGLMQLAPLYLGLELITGRRDRNNE